MKKFEKMLFCTDLDGTLYSDDKTVSKQNLEAIEYFKSEGGLFTFITGRVPQTTGEMCETIKPNAPYGCNNGGGIYDHIQDKYLWKTFISDEVLELVKVVDAQMPEMGIQLPTEKAVYFNKDNEAMKWFRKVTNLPNIFCNYETMKEPIIKVIFGHMDPKQIKELEKLLKSHPKADNFILVSSEPKLYEILPKGVSKGKLLCKMAKLLGIDIGKTIAVGDYYNDVSMIKNAGIGFAVANAVDDAKTVADYITVNNNEHAIAKIIEGLDRGIYKF